jgi:hypothetical protein
MYREGFRAGLLPAICAIAFATAARGSETIVYTYDSLGRLTRVERSGSVNAGIASTYGYDAADNRANVTVGGGTAGPPPPAAFSVADAWAIEGGALAFAVTRSGSAAAGAGVAYATANASAGAGGDYSAASGTLSFAAGETARIVTVTTIDDTVDENDETLFVNLSSPTGGASILDGQAIGTIADNDDPPSAAPPLFSVGDASAIEGGTLVFTVTRSGTTASTFSLGYATANGSAGAGTDYSARSGTLTFGPAESTKTVSVPTTDDVLDENSETLSLDLADASGGAAIADTQGIGTISDNDDPPPPGSNQPPVTVTDSLSLGRCSTASVNVVGNDGDPDGPPPLTLVDVSDATRGDAFVSSTTSITYAAGQVTGSDALTYTVQDGHGATATGLLNVTVGNATCPSGPLEAPRVAPRKVG